MDIDYPIDLTALKKNLYFRYKTNIKFPLIINNITIYDVIKQFQDYIADVIKHQDHICYCYCCFVGFAQLKHISEKDPIIIAVFDITILHHYDFDCYSHNSKVLTFVISIKTT